MSDINREVISALNEATELVSDFKIQMNALKSKQTALEQEFAAGVNHDRSSNRGAAASQIVQALTDSPNFEALVRGEIKTFAMRLPLDIRAATIISTTPLVQPDRDRQIVSGIERRLTIRDLLPIIPTKSGSVEFTRELAYTNAAAIQTAEGAAKAESTITFELATAPVRTIAHWLPSSRQVLDDREELLAFIATRLLYGLALQEEAQILNGDGTGVNLYGIIAQATPYVAPFVYANPTYLDQLRLAITQLQVADSSPTGIVLHPIDWAKIELLKGTDDQYITLITNQNGREVAWRLPVVVSNSKAVGSFLIGDFARGAAIRDRQEARVEISTEHASFFTENKVAILAEERIALTVFKPSAFVVGTFV